MMKLLPSAEMLASFGAIFSAEDVTPCSAPKPEAESRTSQAAPCKATLRGSLAFVEAVADQQLTQLPVCTKTETVWFSAFQTAQALSSLSSVCQSKRK